MDESSYVYFYSARCAVRNELPYYCYMLQDLVWAEKEPAGKVLV
jgi:hypothetical protein